MGSKAPERFHSCKGCCGYRAKGYSQENYKKSLLKLKTPLEVKISRIMTEMLVRIRVSFFKHPLLYTNSATKSRPAKINPTKYLHPCTENLKPKTKNSIMKITNQKT